MREKLAGLTDTSPAVLAHVAAIRQLHDDYLENPNKPGAIYILDKHDEHWRSIVTITKVMPLAKQGAKFRQGRAKSSFSPLRKAIEREVRKTPHLSALNIWNALAAKPPKGHALVENHLGRYVESDRSGSAPANTSFKRFSNMVSETKKAMKNAQNQ